MVLLPPFSVYGNPAMQWSAMVVALMLSASPKPFESDLPPCRPLITGVARSDRVFDVELEITGTSADGTKFRVRTTLALQDGKAISIGGSNSTSQRDGLEEKSDLSYRIRVSSSGNGKARLRVLVLDQRSQTTPKRTVRERITSLRVTKTVPLGKPIELALGKDENTGITYTVCARLMEQENKK